MLEFSHDFVWELFWGILLGPSWPWGLFALGPIGPRAYWPEGLLAPGPFGPGAYWPWGSLYVLSVSLASLVGPQAALYEPCKVLVFR